MDTLKQRIENLIIDRFGLFYNHWLICRTVDRIMVEVENEFAKRKAEEAKTDQSGEGLQLSL